MLLFTLLLALTVFASAIFFAEQTGALKSHSSTCLMSILKVKISMQIDKFGFVRMEQ